ncbi:hypothetical protein [Brevibacillus laterosporus]|uniref:hypothetical protein n=1 Tax=Brevibacillus laterosporus TaxID=1465 RepID=UPI003D1F1101
MVLVSRKNDRDGGKYRITLLYQGFPASEIRFVRNLPGILKLNIPFVQTQSVILDLLGDVEICIGGYFNTCVSESRTRNLYLRPIREMDGMRVP